MYLNTNRSPFAAVVVNVGAVSAANSYAAFQDIVLDPVPSCITSSDINAPETPPEASPIVLFAPNVTFATDSVKLFQDIVEASVNVASGAIAAAVNLAYAASLISIIEVPSYCWNIISLASTIGLITTSLEVFTKSSKDVPPDLRVILFPAASNIKSAAQSIVKLFAEIVKSVPSPSIFSLAPPNTIPTSFGICTSEVAVKLIFAPEVTVKSVLSPSIFSPLPNVTPTFAGITTSVVAVRLRAPHEVTVKSVLSPSILSPETQEIQTI